MKRIACEERWHGEITRGGKTAKFFDHWYHSSPRFGIYVIAELMEGYVCSVWKLGGGACRTI